ncbi:hypothetical protein Tco_0315898 [Tanacetum coccineum]
MVGSLMYLTASRPDLVFAVCMCARYQAKPTEKHLTAVKWVFWYLKGTINMGLWYSKDNGFDLTAFADADHAGCQDLRKSTSGSAQFLGEKLVIWSSKKQKCTAISATEAEYISLSESNMSRENPQAIIVFEEQLVSHANRLVIKKNNQRVASGSDITDTKLRFVVGILRHHKLYKPVSLTATVRSRGSDCDIPWCFFDFALLRNKMVTTRRNSDDDVPNFEAMIVAAVANALPNLMAALRTQITNDVESH